MLISALNDYYNVLSEKGKVLPDGYDAIDISYLIELKDNGEIARITDYREEKEEVNAKGKVKIMQYPRTEYFPKREAKTSVNSEILDHRSAYIFGIEKKDKDDAEGKDKGAEKHKKFVERNLAFTEGMTDPLILAYRQYLKEWQCDPEHPEIVKLGKEIIKNFAFCLEGYPERLLHKLPEIIEKWDREYRKNSDAADGEIAQCAISGEKTTIARLHAQVKIPKGQPSGCSLVCFNNDAESSYGKTQSYNSNVSETVMKHYTEALSVLMKNKGNHTLYDDVTVLHWASNGSETCDALFDYLTISDTIDDENADLVLKSFSEGIKSGINNIDESAFFNELDPNVTFHIAAIKPNASRIAIKFYSRQSFGKVMKNILQHQKDLQIGSTDRSVKLWQIKKELISPKSTNQTVDPSGMIKILEAAVNGTNYPDFLLNTIIRRIKTDSDEEKNAFIKMNDTRMGIIKACINRKNRLQGKGEPIKMALDKENDNPAYLCGRLFSVLEDIQQRASGYNLNRTIRDAYFATASSNPATVFPKLISLAQHHMAKLGNPVYLTNEIVEITEKMGNTFPANLPLTEQGIFMLGYYQQKGYTLNQIKANKEDK